MFQIDGGSNFGSAYFTKVYAYKVDSNRNNLALNSKGPWTANKYQLVTYPTFVQPLTKGAIYTVSWKGSGTGSLNVYFSNSAASSARQIVKNGIPVTANSNYQGITFFSEHFKLDPSLETDNGINLTVKEVKVEEGERATDWCYSDGDYSTTEQIKTGITVKENAISIFGKDVSLQGKITFSSLNSSLQSTINNKADSGDVTSVINSSKEDMAKKLGYASYADMVSAATAGNTIIEGGHIRTSLIEADALVVKTLNATNADGISTLVDKDGMNISKSNNSLLNIYFGNFGPVNYGVINMFSYNKSNDRKSEAIGITPSGIELYTYDGSGAEILRGETRLSFGELKILDESQTGIHIHKTGITLTYSKNKDELGLAVHYVKCIYSAYISSSGSVIDKMGTNIPNGSGNPITFSVSKYATGRYRVKHNIGNTLYHVQITALSNGNLTVALIENIYSTYFEYSTTSSNNGWFLMDAKVFIAVYYESPKLGTF